MTMKRTRRRRRIEAGDDCGRCAPRARSRARVLSHGCSNKAALGGRIGDEFPKTLEPVDADTPSSGGSPSNARGRRRLMFGCMFEAGPEPSRLMRCAYENGVRAFDTAEMYPVPQRADSAGGSEVALGAFAKDVGRGRVFIASKVTGPCAGMEWIGRERLSKKEIRRAIDGSLTRLATDYIDLMMLHWPDRYVPMFGEPPEFDGARHYADVVPIEEQMGALSRAVDEGKLRAIGVSNETPFGVMRFQHLADAPGSGLRRLSCVQNAYNLLCQTFDAGLSECCINTGTALLAYSPLAMGLLTGKYHRGSGVGGFDAHEAVPTGSVDIIEQDEQEYRLNKYKGRYAEAEMRYCPERERVRLAVASYVRLARDLGRTPVELALQFVLRNPCTSAAVVGASSEAQLVSIVEAADAKPLSDDELDSIKAIHHVNPNPAP